MIYRIAACLVLFVLKVFYRFTVEGKENIPQGKGYVIACTHTGWLDVLVLGVSIYPHTVYYMAKQELFKNLFLKWLLTNLQAFPVNRENPGPSSLKIPIRLLKKGKIVGIFPSGTRTKEGEAPLKRGAVYLAEKSKTLLVPAAYEGPAAIAMGDLFKRKKITVRIGEAIDPSSLEDALSLLNTRMMELKSQ